MNLSRFIFLLLAGSFGVLSPCVSAQPTASYEVVTDWGGGLTGKITIRNPGRTALVSWVLEFDWERKIDSIWDATIVSREGNRYQIRSAGWNNEIPPGGTVSFGFNASPGGPGAPPERFVVNNAPIPPPVSPEPGSIFVTLTQTASYNGGFSGNLTILNRSQLAFPAWTLDFASSRAITAVYNASFSRDGNAHSVASGPQLGPGAALILPFTGSGSFNGIELDKCVFNGVACDVQSETAATVPPPGSGISIDSIDTRGDALQHTLSLGDSELALRVQGTSQPDITVASNNPSVVTAAYADGKLQLSALAPGRASLRIESKSPRAVRILGIRVKDAAGRLPGMPRYLSLGSVSEDTTDHLSFWEDFAQPDRNKRVDIRYIYLNGGPFIGWDTWADGRGGRATQYIRNSRRLGIIPFFVFYNIPEGGESYETDLQNVQNPAYMKGYFQNLKLALDLINQESPDDIVGMILEPDFLGYLAQNSKIPPSQIRAITSGAYESGVLKAGSDPQFPDTVKGLVEAINYLIRKTCPQVYFGWQLNLWASPPGGWVTPVPGRGIIRKTDTTPLPAGRDLIYREALAITQFYLDAGIASHGAHFLSIDKYGLDATGAESSAAADPANSIWFWNADHWNNYLAFVRAMRDASKLPVILWQLPVGRINSTTESNPYAPSGLFPDLPSTHQRYEDSSPVFFLGDTFTTSGPRFTYFSQNASNDPAIRASGNRVTWGSHMKEAAAAGVISILFGAGVGSSTHSVGDPPPDSFWWIHKAQRYLAEPVPLP